MKGSEKEWKENGLPVGEEKKEVNHDNLFLVLVTS